MKFFIFSLIIFSIGCNAHRRRLAAEERVDCVYRVMILQAHPSDKADLMRGCGTLYEMRIKNL